ncbi:MAG: hypothetical protein CM1200mP16_09460 [Nitrospina sp.]|nr:MAG: hypothetical protein CM1200mP16_09460 [Nitrospina sp.]
MNIAKVDIIGLENKALELRRLALKIIFQAGSAIQEGVCRRRIS